MKKSLIFTPSALFKFSSFEISEFWFDKYLLPNGCDNIKRVDVDDFIFFLDPEMDNENSSIVVINLCGDFPVFSKKSPNTYYFDRIITVARSIFTNSVKIPVAWREYHDKSLRSIYAKSKVKGGAERLNFDTRPSGENSIYFFAVTEDAVDLQSIPKDLNIYSEARLKLIDAILEEEQISNTPEGAGIILSTRLPQGFIGGATLNQWYDSKLTVEQRSFVDKGHDGPVRLRGAAGTGKTVSLIIKLMRDGLLAEGEEEIEKKVKYGFLTHSLASVDMTSALVETLDTKGIMSGQSKNCIIEIRTLYDLAHQHLKFTLEDLQPLSLDGREGRRLQFELIDNILKELKKSTIINIQYDQLSDFIRSRWSAAIIGEDNKFIYELMNEFASILDAEGIRSGEERGEKYAVGSIHRPNWLINLATELDRRFVLEIHRRYRGLLSDMNTLSGDQMVGDFNSFLDSNRWDSLRNRYGYDAIFVDELHLFTAIERQVLHKLFKKSSDEEGRPKRPPIFMAYDIKQSPNDAFAGMDASGAIFTSTNGLQNSDLIKLDKVFRYTHEISEFLSDLDSVFPAIDIPGEWNAYSGFSEKTGGSKPLLTLYKDYKELFQHVFSEAQYLAKKITGGGRRVAVLCASEEMFDAYLKAAEGQYEGSIFTVKDRAPSSELRHSGKKFIFSMPEYVAGLQFDTVFLINVDTKEAPSDASIGLRRRIISNIYLGSSRAENKLFLSSSSDRGGASDILNIAIERGSLEYKIHSLKR